MNIFRPLNLPARSTSYTTSRFVAVVLDVPDSINSGDSRRALSGWYVVSAFPGPPSVSLVARTKKLAGLVRFSCRSSQFRKPGQIYFPSFSSASRLIRVTINRLLSPVDLDLRCTKRILRFKSKEKLMPRQAKVIVPVV